MAEPTIPSKSELVDELTRSGQDAVRNLRAMPAEAFEQGRYENGWNGREILAHVALHRVDVSTADRAGEAGNDSGRDGPVEQQPAQAADDADPQPARPFGVNDYNDRQVAKRAEASMDESLQSSKKIAHRRSRRSRRWTNHSSRLRSGPRAESAARCQRSFVRFASATWPGTSPTSPGTARK